MLRNRDKEVADIYIYYFSRNFQVTISFLAIIVTCCLVTITFFQNGGFQNTKLSRTTILANLGRIACNKEEKKEDIYKKYFTENL